MTARRHAAPNPRQYDAAERPERGKPHRARRLHKARVQPPQRSPHREQHEGKSVEHHHPYRAEKATDLRRRKAQQRLQLAARSGRREVGEGPDITRHREGRRQRAKGDPGPAKAQAGGGESQRHAEEKGSQHGQRRQRHRVAENPPIPRPKRQRLLRRQHAQDHHRQKGQRDDRHRRQINAPAALDGFLGHV